MKKHFLKYEPMDYSSLNNAPVSFTNSEWSVSLGNAQIKMPLRWSWYHKQISGSGNPYYYYF